MNPLRLLVLAMISFGVLEAATFDPLISDHMVLQRDRPIIFRGTATAGDSVTVRLGDETKKTITGPDGQWEASFKARPGSTTPVDITAQSRSAVSLRRNVLIGDVWICAGQSNMEWKGRQQKPEDLTNARVLWETNPLVRIRLMRYPGQGQSKAIPEKDLDRLAPQHYFDGRWHETATGWASDFSAVGWWFGHFVHKETGMPIGLVDWSVGGAPIESFIRRETLEAAKGPSPKGSWVEDPTLDDWAKGRVLDNLAGRKTPSDERGPNHGFKPSFLWESGPARATWLPVKGVIWYQGESNSRSQASATAYPGLMKAMVADWRAQWGQPEMPFLWVQLSSIDTKNYKSQQWPRFRDNQRRLLAEIPRSGMAVSSDVGAQNDVHPRDKRTVGERLARWALHDIYGRKEIVPSGPLPVAASAAGATVTVRFVHAKGLRTRDGQVVREIEVAGADDVFVPGEAEVRGEVLVIRSSVAVPARVRYGWVPWSKANLVNAEGLPASKFEIGVDGG
jgi:sialate O-acetylesterase